MDKKDYAGAPLDQLRPIGVRDYDWFAVLIVTCDNEICFGYSRQREIDPTAVDLRYWCTVRHPLGNSVTLQLALLASQGPGDYGKVTARLARGVFTKARTITSVSEQAERMWLKASDQSSQK